MHPMRERCIVTYVRQQKPVHRTQNQGRPDFWLPSSLLADGPHVKLLFEVKPVMLTQVGYKYLEARPLSDSQQLFIKGRNMTVWHLIGTMRANGLTKEAMAADLDLPVEAVEEALAYYQENRALIEAEVEAEGRWLREHGYLKDE
jgi:uncharacterized protein (DUF433 family)